MAPDRAVRILAQLTSEGGGEWSSTRLCEVTRDIVGVSGAGIMLMSGDQPGGSLCATNDVSNLIEELHYTLGEGPCVDAHNLDRAVLEPDLADPDTPRWLAFASRALEAGVRALFAFPLHIGAARFGAVNLYRDRPGPLTGDQHADALVLADLVARWVLDVQSEAPPETMAEALGSDADFHFVVHNAAGMVSVQLGIGIADALIRLRAHAFGNDRPLHDVADDIVARRLRLQ